MSIFCSISNRQAHNKDEGTRGLFGLGVRQARVRLMIKTAPGEAEQPGGEGWTELVIEGVDLEAAISELELEAKVPAPEPEAVPDL